MSIHPNALVDSSATIGPNVGIGPFCVVEADVVLREGCRLASHVVIRKGTELGRHNTVFEGAVLGGIPQHVQCPDRLGKLVVGEGNTIREHVTIHRSLDPNEVTRIGDRGYFMVGSHIGHDCRVGDDVILANDVLLGGHVEVADRVVFGGAAAVHQFSRIGRLTMIGGMARVHQDVPPFLTLDGGTTMVAGLNRIGLRRAGLGREEIAQLKAAYQLIYRRGLPHAEMVLALHEEFSSGPAAEFAQFFETGSRGFVQERRTPPGATVRLFAEDSADKTSDAQQRQAG